MSLASAVTLEYNISIVKLLWPLLYWEYLALKDKEGGELTKFVSNVVKDV